MTLKAWLYKNKIHKLKLTNNFIELVICLFKIVFGKLAPAETTAKLEYTFANRFKNKSALMFPHARISLYFILKSLELQRGDEVLMTPLSIADMVNSVHTAGLIPLFVDIELDTYSFHLEQLEKTITPRSRVLFITHLFGLVPDMARLMEIARKHSMIVIEDCSQCFNGTFKGQPVGSFGDAAIFSLTNFKIVSSLFGGLVVSGNEKILNSLRHAKDNELQPPQASVLLKHLAKNLVYTALFSKWIFSYFTYFIVLLLEKLDPRINYRLYSGNIRVALGDFENQLLSEFPPRYFAEYTDAQAYVGLCSLARADAITVIREKNGELLRQLLSNIKDVKVPIKLNDATNVYWRFPILSNDRDGLKHFLLENGIDSAPTFLTLLSKEPGFALYYKETPNAEKVKMDVLVVEVNEDLNEEDVRRMAMLINSYFKG